MLETLDKDPAPTARGRRAPLPEGRERCLRVVIASGALVEVVRRAARAQLLFIEPPNLPDAAIPVRLATVGAAMRTGCRSVPGGAPARGAMPRPTRALLPRASPRSRRRAPLSSGDPVRPP